MDQEFVYKRFINSNFFQYNSLVGYFPLKPCSPLPKEKLPEGFRFFRIRKAPGINIFDAHLFIKDYKLLDILYKLHFKTGGKYREEINFVIQRLSPGVHLLHKSQEDRKELIKRLEHPSWYVNE